MFSLRSAHVMIFKETRLAGAYIIELREMVDERGSFARTSCKREFADGRNSLLDVAEPAGLAFEVINTATTLLLEHQLLAPDALSAT